MREPSATSESTATVGARAENLLGALALAVTDHVARATRAATGLPDTDTTALMLLHTSLDGSRQESLAGPLGLTQSGTARLVDRLEREGCVRREAGPDRRSFAIRTTELGHELAIRAHRARDESCQSLQRALPTGQREALTGVLVQILRQLPETRTDAVRICRMCDPAACGHLEGTCPVTRGLDDRGAR